MKKQGERGKMKKSIRFFIVLYLAKLARIALKVIGRDATYFPGKLAVTLCPDFLGRIDKPQTIIGVTGTNGKTTVCNMIEDTLRENGYDFMDNHLGSNINSGIASTLIENATLTGKMKKEMAVFEIDERSAVKVYPYITPTYLVCTNLFRDSLKRNAHTEFIFDILDKHIPKETKLVLNGDDLIVSSLAKENERVYFGIERLDTDTDICHNIARDMIVCPQCDSKLVYDFVRYNHIGRAHCSKCHFASPKIDYDVTNLDFENMKMTMQTKKQEEQYDLINNNLINSDNMLATISLLRELGLEPTVINQSLRKQEIVDTRYSKEIVEGIEMVTHLAKGMNPIACSRVFDYVRKEKGNKAVILLLDDLHEAANSSENIAWQYDTDYEFLNDESIKQILMAGARHLDGYVRLQMAGVPKEKIVHVRNEMDLVDDLNLEGIDKIFILHDLYAIALKNKIKERIEHRIKQEKEMIDDQKEA